MTSSLLCESSSQRFAGARQAPPSRGTLVCHALQGTSFRSGGVLPRFATRAVEPMRLDIMTHGVVTHPVEFKFEEDEFPKLRSQGLFEKAAEAKHNVELASAAYKQYISIRNHLAYDSSAPDDVAANLIARIEDFISFVILMREVSSVQGFLSTVQLYIRTHYSAPITPIIWAYVKPQLDRLVAFAAKAVGLTPQAGYEGEPDKNELILAQIKACIANWKLHRDSPFAKAFAGLISILVTFGAFPSLEDKPFMANFLKSFKIRSWNLQKESLEFSDMILETFMFFLERGYAAYMQEDMSLLFFVSDEAYEL
jgi:hypothetical protein